MRRRDDPGPWTEHRGLAIAPRHVNLELGVQGERLRRTIAEGRRGPPLVWSDAQVTQDSPLRVPEHGLEQRRSRIEEHQRWSARHIEGVLRHDRMRHGQPGGPAQGDEHPIAGQEAQLALERPRPIGLRPRGLAAAEERPMLQRDSRARPGRPAEPNHAPSHVGCVQGRDLRHETLTSARYDLVAPV